MVSISPLVLNRSYRCWVADLLDIDAVYNASRGRILDFKDRPLAFFLALRRPLNGPPPHSDKSLSMNLLGYPDTLARNKPV